MDIERAQVVILGGGLAGLTAGIRAAQKGLDVVVIEQGSGAHYPCNTRFTSGLFHLCGDDVRADAATLRDRILRATAGETEPDLVEAMAVHLPRAMAWLKSLGVKFIKAGPDGLRANALAPPGGRRTGLHWRGRAGDTLLRTLTARFIALGGRLQQGVTGTALRLRDGHCGGLEAQRDGQAVYYDSAAVVLADGGFPADAELIRAHLCARPERLLQRNAGTARGTGIRMALAAGARLTGMHRFYGHLQHRDAMQRDGLWPYPALDVLATAGLVIGPDGRRFCDEGGGGVFIVNAIAQLPDPLGAFVLFDDAVWQGPARQWLLPPNPWLLSTGATLIRADSVAELAQALGLDPAVLADTVTAYNRYIAGGPRPGQQPERTTARIRAWPLLQPPLRAAPLCAGITSTTGGIATDGGARVLRPDGSFIAGLYAAGGCTGGLEGGGFTGYVGGLVKSSVFGMLAGESVAHDLGIATRRSAA